MISVPPIPSVLGLRAPHRQWWELPQHLRLQPRKRLGHAGVEGVVAQVAHVPLKHPADDAHFGASTGACAVNIADGMLARPVQADAGGCEDAVVLRVGCAEVRDEEVSYFWPVGGQKEEVVRSQ